MKLAQLWWAEEFTWSPRHDSVHIRELAASPRGSDLQISVDSSFRCSWNLRSDIIGSKVTVLPQVSDPNREEWIYSSVTQQLVVRRVLAV